MGVKIKYGKYDAQKGIGRALNVLKRAETPWVSLKMRVGVRVCFCLCGGVHWRGVWTLLS